MIYPGSNSNANPSHRLLTILDKLGYLPATSRVDTMIYTSITNSINELGKSYAKALLFNMCSLNGFSEMELLMNYDLFERSIFKILGKAANPILLNIKKELLISAVMNRYSSSITERDILNKSLTVNDIIYRMRLEEVSELVQNLRTSFRHIIFFYHDKTIRDKVLSAVFVSNNIADAQDVVLSARCNSRWQSLSSSSIICTEIKVTLGKNKTKLRSAETFGHMLTSSEEAESEKRSSAEDYNASVLCECNIAKLSNQMFNTSVESMVASHDYIMIDEPVIAMYESRNMRKRK